jgi:hypothetical protein
MPSTSPLPLRRRMPVPGRHDRFLLLPHHALILLFFLLLPALSACSRSDTWAGRIETVDGVVHVHNPETPLWGADFIPFEEVEVLGGPGSPEEAILSEPLSVETASDGTRMVLDGKDCRVMRFAADGTWLGAFGRAGEGPGEFTGPTDLALLPGGEVLVADQGRMRLSRFTPDGRFLDSVQLEKACSQITTDRAGRIIAHEQPRTPSVSMMRIGTGESGEVTLIDVLDTSGRRTAGFGAIRDFEGIMLGSWMNRVQPAVTVGDSVVLNFVGDDRIEVWSPDGDLARVVHRPLPFTPVEPKEESRQTTNDDGSVNFSMSFEFDLLSTGFAVSPDGRWWAALVALTQTDRRPRPPEQENTPREDEILQRWGIDLFDGTGRWLARQDLGTDYPMAILDWGPGGLYLINANGDATVRRLRMKTPAEGVSPQE